MGYIDMFDVKGVTAVGFTNIFHNETARCSSQELVKTKPVLKGEWLWEAFTGIY